VEGEVPGLAAARMAGLAPTPPDERCRVARGDRRVAAAEAAGDDAGEGGEEAELTPSAGGSFRLLVLVVFIMASVGSIWFVTRIWPSAVRRLAAAMLSCRLLVWLVHHQDEHIRVSQSQIETHRNRKIDVDRMKRQQPKSNKYIYMYM